MLVKESTQLTAIIRQVNDLLCDMRKENNFNFIKNQDITRKFLYHDEIYLTDSGTDISAGNFVAHIISLFTWRM